MIHGVTVEVQKVKTKWSVVTMKTVLFIGFTFSVLISVKHQQKGKNGIARTVEDYLNFNKGVEGDWLFKINIMQE